MVLSKAKDTYAAPAAKTSIVFALLNSETVNKKAPAANTVIRNFPLILDTQLRSMTGTNITSKATQVVNARLIILNRPLKTKMCLSSAMAS